MRANIPSGSTINGEFAFAGRDELGVSQTAFHGRTGMSMQRISEIVNGKRGISPETAWILGGAFGQSPKYWLNLQATHDLTRTKPARPIAPMPEAIKAAG